MILNGIDVVEIERIEKSMQNPAFLGRFFSEKEVAYFESKNFNLESVAAAFAAKEAFSKALGTGIRGFRLNEVTICHDLLGKPYFEFSGNAKRIAEKRKLNL